MIIAALTRIASRATALLSRGRQLIEILHNPYRPEQHYMRGPGPKCRARQLDH